MITVHKFEIRPEYNVFDLPRDAKPLCVQVQRGTPCMWVRLDTDAPKIRRHFYVVGTGHPMPEGAQVSPYAELPNRGRYVGTFQLESHGLVFHVFEGKKP